MAELPQVKKNIFEEETRFRSAVSEAVAEKLGRSINFINYRQFDERGFYLNGDYSRLGTYPQIAAAGFIIFPFDVEIFDVAMSSVVTGSSGTTELDVLLATAPGGSFTSIFTTTPKITSAASNNTWVRVGQTVTGCTAPVLTSLPFPVNANSAIRLDLISAMTAAENASLIVYFRPR